MYCEALSIVCHLFFSNRLTSDQCLEHPWLSGTLCMVENFPSSYQSNTGLTVSSSRSYLPESSDAKSPRANGSIQCRNLETNKVNGTNCSFGLSKGSRYEKDGVHNSDSKGTSPLFNIQNCGANIADGDHKGDSAESEELPVQKRPKNSSEDRRSTSYPVGPCLSCAQCGAHCCHLHTSTPELPRMTRQHRHSSIKNSPVEITVDRGITC
jgi:hypothetical protein